MKEQEVGVLGKKRGRGRDSTVTGENEGEGEETRQCFVTHGNSIQFNPWEARE